MVNCTSTHQTHRRLIDVLDTREMISSTRAWVLVHGYNYYITRDAVTPTSNHNWKMQTRVHEHG